MVLYNTKFHTIHPNIIFSRVIDVQRMNESIILEKEKTEANESFQNHLLLSL